ncbi:MAG TPA: hypothetical protein VNH22_21300 [Blastocatellia bacterium]|jgi:hypothetical protein|nr:hypothetical protein [Blastocatellia bacterium]
MTIKLIKRDQQTRPENKAIVQPSMSQLMMTTRSWVDEYKARKATGNSALSDLRKIS